MLAKAPAPVLVAVAADEPPDVAREYAEARALARATAAGDRQAATSFARRLLPVARRVTRALLGSGTDADDVSQSALIELLESARTYAGQGPLEAWARRITVRVALRWLRRGRRLSLVAHDEDDLGESSDRGDDLREHIPRAVADYLALLPEQQRIALVLRHALDHTLPEIAELTGAPVPTVKSRVLKAEETLRKLIRRDLNLGRPAP
ncbi:RNA polymerase sigma factor [Nannocystis pusilla]|uniref:Sigma-70 family RNA polymerase sigma factor n=1 Tax=Nannocystis pusilla TaxID=889268 RepID=A0ABS7TS02_9BACT|nr:sigma-70 family RNA polymerase sigma factor [Nannocystis pusilla]MBZ5710965.1 sigma-70 family RNA polymerase sigma factor [Nannocystis pusilla]